MAAVRLYTVEYQGRPLLNAMELRGRPASARMRVTVRAASEAQALWRAGYVASPERGAKMRIVGRAL